MSDIPDQQQGQNVSQFDTIMPNPAQPTPIQGHIRGFHTDRQNTSIFSLNYDTTSAAELKRRRDRLGRFGREGAQEELNRLDYVEEQSKKAQSRLDRFAPSTNDIPDTTTNHLEASITYSFPSMMTFDDLAKIPQEQVEYELSGFNPTVPRRWDTVHLFGSRMLLQNVRTEDLLGRYRDDGLVRVEWQSDYRCNLVFTDPTAANRVLAQESYVKDLDVVAAKPHFQLQNETKSIEENSSSFDPLALPFMVWRSSIYSEEDGTAKGSLSMRLATTLDTKEPLEVRKHSRFYLDNLNYFAQLAKDRRRKANDMNTNETVVELAPEQAVQVVQQQQRLESHQEPSILTTKKEQTTLTTRQVIVKDESRVRGRGFAKGRVGAFDMDRPVVERPRHEDTFNQMQGRQRDRLFQQKPNVVEHTPLSVTLAHNQQVLETRKQLQNAREEHRNELELRRMNHPMARTLLTAEELQLQQQYESTGRVHQDKVYEPTLESLQMQQVLELPTSGFAAMFPTVTHQDEIEKQQRLEYEAQLKLQRENEEKERLQRQHEEQQLWLQQQEQERAIAEANAIRIAQETEAQNAMLQEQFRAEAAMGTGGVGHSGNDLEENDDYAE